MKNDKDRGIGFADKANDDARTLRNIREALDGIHATLCEMCAELDGIHGRVSAADGLTDDDRDNLLIPIERAWDELCSLQNDCYDPATGAIDVALDAFKRLPMSE